MENFLTMANKNLWIGVTAIGLIGAFLMFKGAKAIPADVLGCTDPLATNYNPLATLDDSSCNYGCTGLVDGTIVKIFPCSEGSAPDIDPDTGLPYPGSAWYECFGEEMKYKEGICTIV